MIASGLVMAVTGREIIQWRLHYMGDYRPSPQLMRHAGVVVVLSGIGCILLALGIYQALANVAAVASFVGGIWISFADPTLRAGPRFQSGPFSSYFRRCCSSTLAYGRCWGCISTPKDYRLF
jgi:hypothetical protein